MSELDDLPYDERDKYAVGYKKAKASFRAAFGHKPSGSPTNEAIDRSDQRRNPPITLPRLKFMNEV